MRKKPALAAMLATAVLATAVLATAVLMMARIYAVPAMALTTAQMDEEAGDAATVTQAVAQAKEKAKDKDKDKEKGKDKKGKDKKGKDKKGKDKKGKDKKEDEEEPPTSGGLLGDYTGLFGLGAGFLIVVGVLLARKILRSRTQRGRPTPGGSREEGSASNGDDD